MCADYAAQCRVFLVLTEDYSQVCYGYCGHPWLMLRKASRYLTLPRALLCPNATRPVTSSLRSPGEDGATRATPYLNLSICLLLLLHHRPLAPCYNLKPSPTAAPRWAKSHQSPTDIVGTGADNPLPPPRPPPRRTAHPDIIRAPSPAYFSPR